MADIVVIVSQVHTSFQTHQAVYINYVEYFAVQKEKGREEIKTVLRFMECLMYIPVKS